MRQHSKDRHAGARAVSRTSRRGATTVFVAILSVALVGMAAFAIDLSRLNLGVNELQTVSDASALRAARVLQFDPDSNPDAVTQAFAQANYSPLLQQNDDTPFALSGADIQPGWWVDSTRTFTPGGLGAGGGTGGTILINAVQVRAAKTSRLLFGRLVTAINGAAGTARQTPTRNATAWVANITRATCPAPWAFPLNAFNQEVFGLNDFTMRLNAFDSLSATLRAPDGLGALRVSMLLYPAGFRPAGAPSAPEFNAIDDQDGNGTNMNDYADQLARAGVCDASPANGSSAIGETEYFPGRGQGAVPMKTVNGAFGGGPAGRNSMCVPPPNNSRAADCFGVGALSPGVDVVVTWVRPVAGGGSGTVMALGGFRVMCVFGIGNGGNANGNGNGNGGQPETCQHYTNMANNGMLPAGTPNLSNMPEGTVLGYPIPTAPASGVGVGDAPSLAKKLILVR